MQEEKLSYSCLRSFIYGIIPFVMGTMIVKKLNLQPANLSLLNPNSFFSRVYKTIEMHYPKG